MTCNKRLMLTESIEAITYVVKTEVATLKVKTEKKREKIESD